MVHSASARGALAGLAVLVVASCLPAQPVPQPAGPARLRWTDGQVLVYKVEHATTAADSSGENKAETKSLLKLTRRWQVTGVDASGVGTLSLSLSAMAQERTTPAGDVLSFDSAAPEKGTPQLKDYLSKFVNTPLATLRIDAVGQVAEVKETKLGSAAGYQNELPFVGVLPAEALKPGMTWERPYQITLAPPLGTGEKYEAVQKFACKAVTAEAATVTLVTELKTALKAPADAVPLWQFLPAGEIVYDLRNGRLHAARLVIDKKLDGHAGEGSSTAFQSVFTIQYAGDR